ncbi:hypothetical protein V8E53_004695, partial [Lactarius tabidus]
MVREFAAEVERPKEVQGVYQTLTVEAQSVLLEPSRSPPAPTSPHSSPCPGVNERDLRPARVLAKRWRMQAVRGVVFHLDHKYKVSWECTTPYPSRISEDEGRKVEVLFRTALCSCFCCRGGRKEEDGIPFPYPLCAQMGARDEGGGKPFLSCALFAPEWRQGQKGGACPHSPTSASCSCGRRI